MRLPGRQIRVEDEYAGVVLHGPHQHILQLAATDEVLGVGIGPALNGHIGDRDARGSTQLAQLVYATLIAARGARLARLQHHQHGALGAQGGARGGQGAVEFLLQRAHQFFDINRRAVKGHWRQHGPRRQFLARGHQVGQVQIAGPSVLGHAHRRHQVQAQKGQVDQIVARDGLIAQMGVHQAQPAEASVTGAHAAHRRQHDARGIADHDVLDVAPARDQCAHLTPDLARQPAHESGQLG